MVSHLIYAWLNGRNVAQTVCGTTLDKPDTFLLFAKSLTSVKSQTIFLTVQFKPRIVANPYKVASQMELLQFIYSPKTIWLTFGT